MNNKLIGWILGIAGALALTACGSSMTQATLKPESTASPTMPDRVVAEGRLVPYQWVDLSFTVPGKVKQVNVAEGDSVRQGDPLVQLDDEEALQAIERAQLDIQQAQINVDSAQHTLNKQVDWSPNSDQLVTAQANLANAEAAVKAAQSNYDKVAYLPWVSSTQQSMALEQATNNFEKAKGDFDYLITNRPDATLAANSLQAARVALSGAQLSLAAARTALEKLSLLAPFSGTITDVTAKPGQVVAPGEQMVTLASIKDWIVETDNLTELEVTSIKVGQKTTITFDAVSGKTFHGDVKEIAQHYIEKNGDINYTVKIALNGADPQLRWGMTASVEFAP
jgi:multidrug resistance efflux pump